MTREELRQTVFAALDACVENGWKIAEDSDEEALDLLNYDSTVEGSGATVTEVAEIVNEWKGG